MGTRLEKSQIREIARRYPEYKDGRLTEEQAEGIVARAYGEQDELLPEHLKAEIPRWLVRMAARGEVEHDPDQGASRRKP